MIDEDFESLAAEERDETGCALDPACACSSCRMIAHARECRAALRRVPHGPDDDACPPGVHVSGCVSLVHRPPDPRPACTCHVSEIRRLLGETT